MNDPSTCLECFIYGAQTGALLILLIGAGVWMWARRCERRVLYPKKR